MFYKTKKKKVRAEVERMKKIAWMENKRKSMELQKCQELAQLSLHLQESISSLMEDEDITQKQYIQLQRQYIKITKEIWKYVEKLNDGNGIY